MPIPFDHVGVITDIQHKLGAENAVITKTGTFDEEPFLFGVVSPGFAGAWETLGIKCLMAARIVPHSDFVSDCSDDAAVGAIVWTNPTDAEGDSSAAAQVTVNGTVSHYLSCLNPAGIDIPAGATITGIKVVADANAIGGSLHDDSVRLFVGGVAVGTDRASSVAARWTAEEIIWGGENDLWGLTPSPAEVNAADFGVGISVTATTGTAYVYSVTIYVYYSISVTYKYQIKGDAAWEDLASVTSDWAATDTPDEYELTLPSYTGASDKDVPFDFRIALTSAIENTIEVTVGDEDIAFEAWGTVS
jgi:hypothetical protein